jgi:hypothetical protein
MLFDAATGFKAIAIHSVAIPVAVANKKGGAVTSFVDNSDGNRWDISNRRDRSKVTSEESATIDRNTGHITASSITTVGDASQHVKARGSCATIDSSKRKFPAQVPLTHPTSDDTDEITAERYAAAVAGASQIDGRLRFVARRFAARLCPRLRSGQRAHRAAPCMQIGPSCARARGHESILRFVAMTANAKRRSHERF